MITNHTELLNYLIKKHNLISYLEIGVQNPANNFDLVDIPKDPNGFNLGHKFGIEPDRTFSTNGIFHQSSDTWFERCYDVNGKRWMFDLIFIDGLHHCDQAKRDFENSLKCLNENGFIVIHDTLPDKEEYTHVPRDSKIWYGDVYKFAMTLGNYPVIYNTINIDCGCTVIRKGQSGHVGGPLDINKITWDHYNLELNKMSCLHVIQPSEIETYL